MIENIQTEVSTSERAIAAKIDLYYDLLTADRRPAPLLIALHGYGANKGQMMREARAMAPDGFAIASLQGFHQHIKEPRQPGRPLRFGFGWLTNFKPEESVAIHHRALLDMIEGLIAEGVADEKRIFLLGFSQTCALNFRFAFTYAHRLRGVIGICGGLPGDWETSDTYQATDAAILYLHGSRDEFYPPERVNDYGERLKLRAIDVESHLHQAAHEFVASMRDDVRVWLQQRT